MTAKKFVKILLSLGFVRCHQTGSHLIFKHPDSRITTVSMHVGDIATGTVRQILKDINLSEEELRKML